MTRPAPYFLACAAVVALLGGCVPSGSVALSVWVAGGDQEVGIATPVASESDIYSASRRSVRLRAAIRETVAIQVVLSATRADGPYEIHIGDFLGGAGTLPAAEIVRVFRAQYESVERFPSWYPEHAARPARPQEVPDVLVPWNAPRGGGPVNVETARNEIIWVDLFIPPTTEPGEYTSRLRVRRTTDDAVALDVRVVLQVLPIVLPAAPGLDVVARVDPNDLFVEHLRWPRQVPEEIRLLPDAPNHQAAIRILDGAMLLFHEHSLMPVLWASFPKFSLVGERDVAIDWTPYDELVGRWLDGSGFPDRAPLTRWVLPVSLQYPNAERNGGFDSPQYARLLAGYLAESRRHFESRDWMARCIARICPPEPLTQAALDRVRRIGGIIRQSESNVSLMAHLPAESLRPFGWYNAPVAELRDVRIWAPPAMQFDVAAMQRQRSIGRETWFMPDRPPYSGSLWVGAPATDPLILPWQAYQYGCSGIWLEHAARCGQEDAKASGNGDDGLLYAGMPYGMIDEPLSSIRLKRLRRGIQDISLLRLLENTGKQRLAQTIASRVVRWSFTDACVDHLLSTRSGGWPRDPAVLRLARELMYQELSNEFDPTAAGASQQLANLAGWSQVMAQESKILAEVVGTRLATGVGGLNAVVQLGVMNSTDRAVSGSWRLEMPPAGWSVQTPPPLTISPNQRQLAWMEVRLAGLAASATGITPFEMQFDSDALGAFAITGRLAVAASPLITDPIRLDGDLSDWPRTPNNGAGDFRLVRGVGGLRLGERADVPTLPTQAFFCMDRERLYIGVFCGLREGEKPVWIADNSIPIDGAMPWGQDVVEILLCPANVSSGTSADIFQLQIKPSGLVVARRGCATHPPMGAVEDWQSGAAVMVRVGRTGWVVEAAIPIAALGRPAIQNRVWGVNITRLDAARGEYSSWSGARGNCYLPQSLGNLILMRAY